MNLIKVVPIFHRAMIRKNRMIQKQTHISIDQSKELKYTHLARGILFFDKDAKKKSANGAGKTGYPHVQE